ncbi:hypothetical protein ILUMI_00518, partial [Ignelater luminosus]
MQAEDADTNTNISKSVDYDNILQSDIPVVKTIHQMREARAIMKKNIDNYQKVLTEDQQSMLQKKSVKCSLEKVVIELQGKLNEENHYSNETKSEIDKMREMSNQIGKHLVRNNTLLQECLQNKTNLGESIEKQKISVDENLKKMVEVYENKLTRKTEVIKIINNQRKAFKENLKIHENQCLEILQEINSHTNKLEELNKLFKELHRNSEDCCTTVNLLKKRNEDLKSTLQDKQKCFKEILQVIEEKQDSFGESNEKVCNALDENNLIMQKIETEIRSVERAVAHQKVYNNDLQEKISQSTLIDLNTDIKLLETNKNEHKVKYEDNVKQLNDVHSLKLTRKEGMEIKKTKGMSFLKDIEQDLSKYGQLVRELELKTETTQSALNELRQGTDKLLNERSACEQQLLSVQYDINKILSEINELQQNNQLYEHETKQLINNISDEIDEIALKIDRCKEEKQSKRAAIIEKINLIKSNFDTDTSKETEEFENIQKQLHNDIQEIEKKLRDTRNAHLLQQDELKQLSEECDTKKMQIKNLENLKKVLSNNTTPTFEPP